MSSWKDKNVDNLVKAFLSIKTKEECYSFLEDLCTITEIIDMSKRLMVARYLDEKMSYTDIVEKTGLSTATISRISKCYEYGDGGYKMIIERLKEQK